MGLDWSQPFAILFHFPLGTLISLFFKVIIVLDLAPNFLFSKDFALFLSDSHFSRPNIQSLVVFTSEFFGLDGSSRK